MLLAPIALFNNLPAEAQRQLEQGGTILEPRDGATIFGQGDHADALYAIIGGHGHVRIGAIDRNSKALMVEVLGVGEIFGEIGLIAGDTRTAAAVTHGRVRLMKIRKMAFLSVLATCPRLGEALCQKLAQRLRRTYELFQDATFETLEVRLARQLLYLAANDGRTTPQGVRLNARLRQPDLADLLGASTRSIISILNVWRARDLVAYDTDRALLTVKNTAAMRAIVEVNPRPYHLGEIRAAAVPGRTVPTTDEQ